jgi:hypothetical protein
VSSCHVVHWIIGQGSTYYSTIRINIYFVSGAFHEITKSKQIKSSIQKPQDIKYNVNNNNSKARMAAGNFGISNKTNSLKFQKHETHTDFEYRAINDVKKIFSAKQEFEFVVYL